MTEKPTEQRRKTKTIIAAIVAALVVVAAAATTAMAMSSGSSHTKAVSSLAIAADANATYARQMSAALQPLVASNQQLSAAMNAADGSRAANNAINVGLKTARTALTSTQGAVGAIVVPTGGKTLSQQASQGLTQENGYLQVVSATFNDPTSASAAQVQPQAANLISALIPLETVAPGAQKSVYGVDNFYSWSQSAAKIAKARDAKPSVIVQQNTTTPTVAPPSDGGSDYGSTGGSDYTSTGGSDYSSTGSDRAVNDTVGRPTITAGPNVSDGFAKNILIAAATYDKDNGTLPDGVTLSVTSPATGSDYNVSYSNDGSTVYATNLDGSTSTGNDVSFPVSDADGTG